MRAAVGQQQHPASQTVLVLDGPQQALERLTWLPRLLPKCLLKALQDDEHRVLEGAGERADQARGIGTRLDQPCRCLVPKGAVLLRQVEKQVVKLRGVGLQNFNQLL